MSWKMGLLLAEPCGAEGRVLGAPHDEHSERGQAGGGARLVEARRPRQRLRGHDEPVHLRVGRRGACGVGEAHYGQLPRGAGGGEEGGHPSHPGIEAGHLPGRGTVT